MNGQFRIDVLEDSDNSPARTGMLVRGEVGGGDVELHFCDPDRTIKVSREELTLALTKLEAPK